MATAPEQMKKRPQAESADAFTGFVEVSAAAGREYLATANGAALNGLRTAFALQNEAIKAGTELVEAAQTAATKVATAGAKLIETSVESS